MKPPLEIFSAGKKSVRFEEDPPAYTEDNAARRLEHFFRNAERMDELLGKSNRSGMVD